MYLTSCLIFQQWFEVTHRCVHFKFRVITIKPPVMSRMELHYWWYFTHPNRSTPHNPPK